MMYFKDGSLGVLSSERHYDVFYGTVLDKVSSKESCPLIGGIAKCRNHSNIRKTHYVDDLVKVTQFREMYEPTSGNLSFNLVNCLSAMLSCGD